MSITNKVVNSNPDHGEVYSIQHNVVKFVSDFFPVSSTNKTDRHDITEILLKVALSTINLTLNFILEKKRSKKTTDNKSIIEGGETSRYPKDVYIYFNGSVEFYFHNIKCKCYMISIIIRI